MLEDEGGLRIPRGGVAHHAYAAALKRIMGKGRAEMSLAELEATLAWLERNRIGDHLAVLEGDARYGWTVRQRRFDFRSGPWARPVRPRGLQPNAAAPGFPRAVPAWPEPKRRGNAMRTPKAAIACCLALLAAPAWAQNPGAGASTETSPAATPAPAAVPDAAPPAIRPREAGAVVPIPTWLDRNGNLVETHPNTYADPDRMDAGKPLTPMPWGSVVGAVPGMNAGPAYRPLAPGDVVGHPPADGGRQALHLAAGRRAAGPGAGHAGRAGAGAALTARLIRPGEVDQRLRRRRRLFRQQRMPGIAG